MLDLMGCADAADGDAPQQTYTAQLIPHDSKFTPSAVVHRLVIRWHKCQHAMANSVA